MLQGQGAVGDLVVALLPALLSQANLGLVHNHGVKHVTLLLCHGLHLGLHTSKSTQLYIKHSDAVTGMDCAARHDFIR